jgi:hypothetical protein
MAALEEEGLIAAPHTSAGRVPTDAGYRLFVDRLSSVKPMSAAERAAIAQFLEGAVDLDDVVDRTVRLLASLTNQVAVMQYPSLTRSGVRHIEFVPMSGDRLMIVLIVNTGRVEQRVIETTFDLTSADGEATLGLVRAKVNAKAVADEQATWPSGRAVASVLLEQGLGPDGLGGLDIVLHDGAQDREPALIGHGLPPSAEPCLQAGTHSVRVPSLRGSRTASRTRGAAPPRR